MARDIQEHISHLFQDFGYSRAIFSIPIARTNLCFSASTAVSASWWRHAVDWSQGLTAIPMLAATALSRPPKVQNWHSSIATAASK
jgi:hypothetical protein